MNRGEKRRAAWAALRSGREEPRGVSRPYLGVRFECCNTYTRIYRSHDRSFYEGRCPRCLAPVRIRVGPDGTSHRFFRAF